MTRRLVLAALALALALPALAQSQSYQPVRVDLTAYGAYASGDIASWGFGGAVEVKYNLLDTLALGGRHEGAGFVSHSMDVGADGSSSFEQGGRGVSAFLAKVDWYLTTSSVRPFLGVGAGHYSIGAGSQSATSGGAVVQTASTFKGWGFCPQLGVNFGAFRMAAVYHVIGGGDMTVVTQAVGAPPTTVVLPKNYFAFELGGTIGGRRTAGPQ
jgi:hypothetical protein